MNQKIGLFYGTNNDNSKIVAEMIQESFAQKAAIDVALFDVAHTDISTLLDYDKLIIGCPTWYIGQLQEDWDMILPELGELDLQGKQVALFGLGDQFGYPDTFVDAIGILGDIFTAAGAELVGFTVVDGFEFTYSEGVEDGVFLGLALDEDNQAKLTPERVNDWVEQLIEEFHLEPIHA